MKKEKELRAALSKFIAAKKKMEKLHDIHNMISVELEYSIYSTGESKIKCTLYQGAAGHVQGKTWEEAFVNLRKVQRERGLD